ncbi:cytochrome b/b6 domain-containing protein [uncultured Piscinibacter sp.]|uniref:cytochrome b/b6 domain-containing protein n=1 Tax=uncultured Piscinibacter sp. TaxID=1131835 RepID=UPI00260EB954|nr:cytochrome b/b6 domain-containing protein [uncultured Piscinibacter sp.]
MNTESRTPSTLVWDVPVRVFHWLLVASFAGAWITAESEHWRLVHVTLGYTMAGLVAFRVLWGLVGTRYARFSSFVRGPRAAFAYLRSLLGRSPEHHTGHNPAGALAIVGLLALIGVTAASGFATYNDLGGEWLEELHELAANGLMALVVIHVAGVVVGSLVHKENLVRSMFTGRKPVPQGEGIRRGWATLAAVMIAAVLGFWWTQWQAAPQDAGTQLTRLVHDGDRDDD